MTALAPFLFRHRWIWIGFFLGGLILAGDPPAGLSPEGQKALALAATAALFLLTEAMPLPAVAVLIGVFEVVLGIAGPRQVSRTFISDSVLFIMGSLMIAETIVRQRLDKRLALAIVRITGPRVNRIVAGLMAVSALIASFIGEHTVAAMMLPVGMTLIAGAHPEPARLPRLRALILLSIAYGAVAAAVGTPSGGARNAIVIAYWRQLFDLHVSYLQWMVYLYPLVILQAPIVAWVLIRVFRPEVTDLGGSIERLKARVSEEGRLSARELWTVVIFLFTVVLWITVSDKIGLGTVAMIGVSLYLMFGMVNWEDLSRGINWGVIFIYAGAISLGVTMRDTGAAQWAAGGLLSWVEPLGIHGGIPLLLLVALLTMAVAAVMSSGATVGLLAPVTLHMAELSGTSVIAAGLVTAAASAFTYMTPLGSPACGMAYGNGLLRRTDFMEAGWRMNLVSLSLVILMAVGYWHWLGV